MVLRHSLRQAIDQDQLQLHYQPLVDLKTGLIVSAEALVRWNHPEFGMLRPDLFISLAEEFGLIGPLGEWVLRAAICQMKAWDAQGLKPSKNRREHFRRSAQDGRPSLRRPKKVLAETGADARRFELELTEGVLLEHSPEKRVDPCGPQAARLRTRHRRFRRRPCLVPIFEEFPRRQDQDRPDFRAQLVADSSDAVIIDVITALAQNFKLGLVAEGIETIEQRDFLRDRGCTTGQGYFFSLPLAAEDFAWMLKKEIALPIIPAKKRKGRPRRALKP